MWEVLWLILDFVFSVGLEALVDVLVDLPKERSSRKRQREAELIGGAVIAAAVGILSSWAAPGRVLPPGPFRGVSLIIVPIFLGITMDLWGRLRRKVTGDTSALATWYGGAALGLGLALSRLLTLG